MPDEMEITNIGGSDPGKTQGVPKEYKFLMRFNIKNQTASVKGDRYEMDERDDEIRFNSEKLNDDYPDYVVVNRKTLSYVRRQRLGELDKDGFTIFFDDKGFCEKVDRPASSENQI